jgi:membrane protease subunit HflK
MPWNTTGGAGGGQGGSGGNGGRRGGWQPGNPGPWGQGPSGPSGGGGPDFGGMWRGFIGRFGSLTPGGGLGAPGILIAVVVGLILWMLSGFYTIGPNQVGLNLVFGKYTGKTSPGLNYNWPFPIGSVDKLNVTDTNAVNVGFTTQPDYSRPNATTQIDVPEESLMLTGDENIADLKFVVFWQIDPSRPEDYAFNVADPKETVKAVAESAMREVVGQSVQQDILTAGRKVIEPKVKALMQDILTSYRAGVEVRQVQLQSVEVPSQVIAAFRDVTAAQQDQSRMRNEAQAYANKVVPEARGKAAGIVQAAEGYRVQTVAEAKGQASRFDQVYTQYKNAPQVTRERIYIETMQNVFSKTDNVLIDDAGKGQGVVPYLPLPRLNGADRAAPTAGDKSEAGQ